MKASSAGSTSGRGSRRGLFGRAFATRAASRDAAGTGAPSRLPLAAALAFAVCALLALFAPAAQAAPSRAKLAEPCTANGAGAGQCNNPKGVAVNTTGAGGVTAGDFYVAENSNNRISEFSAAGTFVRAWGIDVIPTGGTGDTGSGFEVCTAASTCKAATAGITTGGGINNPAGIAVDPATGNVYLYSVGNRRVEVFSATGEFEGAFGRNVAGATDPGDTGLGLEFCTTVCQQAENSEAVGGFGSAGSAPRAMAVDSNGNVYVPDSKNLRLDEFSPTLNVSKKVIGASFVRGIGWNVKAGVEGAEALQVCTTAGTGCKKGTFGNGAGQFLSESPIGVAVDSSGYIYVVSVPISGSCSASTTCRIEKFNPDGTFKENFGPAPAVLPALPSPCQLTYTSGTASEVESIAVAVDPTNQHVLALKKTASALARVCELTSSGGELTEGGIFPSVGLEVSSSLLSGLAVGTGERVYAANGNKTSGAPALYILGPVPPPSAEVLPATEVTSTAAKLNGKVTVPAPGGPGFDTSYRFEYSADGGVNWTKVPASDIGLGDGSAGGTSSSCPTPKALVCNVSQNVTELQPSRTYRFRLVATTGPSVTSTELTFTTLAAKPSVLHTIALPVTGTTAELTGDINPNNSPTTYHIEWGLTEAPYEHRIPSFERHIGLGGEPVGVDETLSGLQFSTTYHFRIVATNACSVGCGTTFGPDATFTTNSWSGLNEAGLPDNRGIELVSPADKRPDGTTQGFIVDFRQINFQAATDGNSFLYPILSGLGDTTAGGGVRYLAKRSASGWQSTQISAPSLLPSPEPSQIVWASPDLGCEVIETVNPITADTPPADIELGVTNLYLRDAAGHITLITDRVPTNPEVSLNYAYAVLGAPADCNRIFFRTEYKLLPGTPSGVYEWDNGTLRDAGILPNGVAAAGVAGPSTAETAAEIGGMGGLPSYRDTSGVNAVSPAGRLFFHALSNQGGDNTQRAVFVRKGPGPGETVDASQKLGGTKENNGANYQTASPDGSHLFFTADYGLAAGPAPGAGWPTSCHNFTTNSALTGLNGEGCDLYDYNVAGEQLTDLSADTNPSDPKGAAVNGVVAVSDDGSYVYFAAEGQLVPGKGKTYLQDISEKKVNIYLAHAGTLAYVTTIDNSTPSINSGDLSRNQPGFPSNGNAGGNLMVLSSTWTAQATPDGRRLLFTARSNVTGYPAGLAAQAYLYSAESGSTVCVSCRPDGEPSLGNGTTEPIRSALTQVEERYRTPSSISDDGSQVFFTMPDVLAPGAQPGKANLYEWNSGQVSLLSVFQYASDGRLYEEGFLDASPSGSDVFVMSPLHLSPYDFDTVTDIYDFRAGGGFPNPPTPPVPCDPAADQCQGTPTAAPGASSPASQSFSGAGNPPLQTPPCPKGKVRKHGKCLKKHHKRHHAKRAGHNRGGQK